MAQSAAQAARNKLGGYARHRAPDHPDVVSAREQLDDIRAVRAVDDPAELAWAARMIRIGLARKLVTLADLDAAAPEVTP